MNYNWRDQVGLLNTKISSILVKIVSSLMTRFNVNMKREYGWSPIGEKVVVKVPTMRAINVSYPDAICSNGCIDLKARSPN